MQLRACAWGPADAHGAGPDALTLGGLRPAGAALAPLLRALTPAGRTLRRLRIQAGGTLEAAALRDSRAVSQQGAPLAQLCELALEAGCAPGSCGWEALLAAVPQAAPQLTALELGGGEAAAPAGASASPPPSLAASPALQQLAAAGVRLSLPAAAVVGQGGGLHAAAAPPTPAPAGGLVVGHL